MSEDRNIHIFSLFEGLDEAWLGLWLLLFSTLLTTSVLKSCEDNPRQLIVFSNRDGCPGQYKVLKVVFGLDEANILCLIQVGSYAHRLAILVWNSDWCMCLVDESNSSRVILVERLDESPNETKLSLIEDLQNLSIQIFH